MKKVGVAMLVLLIMSVALARTVNAATVHLSDLDLSKAHQDWGKPHANRSVDDHPLNIAGHAFDSGVGTHAGSAWYIDLGGRGERFRARVGVDDEIKSDSRAHNYPIEFRLFGDSKSLFNSGAMRVGDQAQAVDVDVRGVRTLILVVKALGPGITDGHGDWAEASIDYTGEPPVAIDIPPDKAEVLTPKPPSTPQINCAKVVGVRPGHPLLFMVATSGERPMTFAAESLPKGLSIDAQLGLISGAVVEAGDYRVKVRATNVHGSSEREVRVEVGDRIALTPPMGWNSWNCFASAVSDEKVRAAADAMVKSGLIDHGWTYINIDDCWQVRAAEPLSNKRTPDGMVRTNKKFPNMKALTDYIHAKGLRAGIYSSPGERTCGGFDGSYQFEAQDARQYAQWGFDYLKYDWCSYSGVASKIRHSPHPPAESEIFQHPYRVMRDELAQQNRDIVFSLCQYGMGNVWTWGEQVGGNCWRTTDDINDSWGSMAGIGFNQNGHEIYAGPGHWNDPDMLVVGKVGWGPALHPTHLSPNEQYTHITLWSLLAAPLLIGCDMTQLDDFTLSLLTNDEVIAVNQDPLGKQAKRVIVNEQDTEVWSKDMEDGSKAVGLFNRSEVPQMVAVKWSDLGISGSLQVRDLWQQKSLGAFGEGFSTEVPRHGVVLIKVSLAGTFGTDAR
jgi:alpha-galactosidase